MAQDTHNAEAGPGPSSSALKTVSNQTPYQESSQFRHWRYSRNELSEMRAALNEKSKEVVARNQELERKAQSELHHPLPAPAPSTAYLSTDDELLLLRFYCIQVSKICKHGFGLPEVVEATAISYLKRFYLKNSVMEWHPKNIMPTCLFLAAKTTNYPVLIDAFIPKFAKLQPADVLDTEFLVAQSLNFQFWIRGAEKGVRGWFLEFQEQPNFPISKLQTNLPNALKNLEKSRLTDLEFVYTPSQISLACWHSNSPAVVNDFLTGKYDENPEIYGMAKDQLLDVITEISEIISGVMEVNGDVGVDMKAVKDVDKRLKMCSNPEKVPGTALYIRRKQLKDAEEASEKAVKTLKAQQDLKDQEMVFGDVISKVPGLKDNKRRPLSPRVSVRSPSMKKQKVDHIVKTPQDAEGKGDVPLEDGGMGIPDEAMGMKVGGKGLKEAGQSLNEE